MSRFFNAALLVVAGSLGSTTPAFAAETLKLDLRDPANLVTSLTPPAQSAVLAVGEKFVITVSGTGGTFAPERYDYTGTCGVAEVGPSSPSPGAPPTPAGWDAQTVYAAPVGAAIGPDIGNACVNVTLPKHVSPTTYTGFKVAVGAGPYTRPVPIGGDRSVPRADHTYTYEFVGTGEPLRFRFADGPVSDNSGIFSIAVRTAAECAAVSCAERAGVAFDNTLAPLTQPTAAPAPPVPPVVDPGQVGVKGISVCNLDRVLSVRLSQPRGVKFAKTVYYLNGAKLRTVSGSKIFILSTSRIRAQKFRRLPNGILKLRVDIRTSGGKLFTVNRTFSRCQPRIKARIVSR